MHGGAQRTLALHVLQCLEQLKQLRPGHAKQGQPLAKQDHHQQQTETGTRQQQHQELTKWSRTCRAARRGHVHVLAWLRRQQPPCYLRQLGVRRGRSMWGACVRLVASMTMT